MSSSRKPPPDAPVAEEGVAVNDVEEGEDDSVQPSGEPWPVSAIPYYIAGRRVTHAEYVAWEGEQNRLRAVAELARASEGLDVVESPTPDSTAGG
jgi:hypothetical protein